MRPDANWSLAICARDAAATPEDANAFAFAPARVPGTATQALIDSGGWSWDDPIPLDERDVWYRTTIAGAGLHILIFEGLATFAEVWLDDTRILVGDNMFVAHRVDISLSGEHCLSIRFRATSAALEGRKGRAKWRPRMIQPSELRFARTSAMGRMPGFAPPAPPVGPWRPVQLVSREKPEILSAQLSTRLDNGDGLVEIELEFSAPVASATARCGDVVCTLVGAGGNRFLGALRLPCVERWFPHTHGSSRLYHISATIDGENALLGSVGFRDIAIDRGSDGLGFSLRVNGVDVFCRGAVWTPLDPLSLQNDPAALARTIGLAKEAGVNMLRVGATGVYETEEFYRACDAAGILVWQDFMFSNFDYPVADAGFVASVETEARQFLKRTSGSPSIAILCGGNEVYQQAAMMGVAEANWRSALFEDILPRISAELRPDAHYVVNSPSGGALPFHSDAGVAHYYGVGAYRRPLEDARRSNVRFASECLGFANVPEACALGNDFGAAPLSSPLWRPRIPRDQGAMQDFEGVRDHYVGLLYAVDPQRLKADEPERYLDLSRAAVAEVIEATIGEWRRPSSSCAGALLWFWKDLWASSGWGALDWSGAPKSPWWAMRRAFRPVQIVLSDEGVNGLHVHCLNESGAPFVGKIALRCYRGRATVIMNADREIEIGPRGSISLRDCDLWGAFFDTAYAYRFGPPSHEATIATLIDRDGVTIAEAWHFPIGRPAALFAPIISVDVFRDDKGYALRLETDRIAQSVKIEDANLTSDDNWFHLAPGASKIVRFHEPDVAPCGTVAALGAPAISYRAR
ncbi:MAG: glycoside hydrolase family 2 protein [Rhodoblastus sp.]|nr:glycoside hydrolase family 2 protein [Rhodoblastus sp.]